MARRRTRRRLRKRANKGKSRVGSNATQNTIKTLFSMAADPGMRKTIKHAAKATNKILNKTRLQRKPGFKPTYGGVYNIKSDQERKTYTYYKQRVTKQQQRKINRRFRTEDAQKYVITDDYQWVDTIPQQTNNTKWLWVTHNGFKFLSESFAVNPSSSGSATTDKLTGINNEFAKVTNKDQAIYFNKFKSVYEIFNPCNYDMNVVIYDIVCKKDTHTDASTSYAAEKTISDSETYFKGDPISLMYYGMKPIKGPYPYGTGGNQTTVQLSDDITGSLYSIDYKPTESYAFNMHWTIVGKKKIRLQPGATMEHHFTYKAKNLMNRGYYGYQYATFAGTDVSSSQPVNRAIQNLTCGTLFKVWGQISGSTYTKANTDTNTAAAMPIVQDNHHAVVNLTGKIMIKENYKQEFYICNPKITYTQHRTSALWSPTDEEELGIPTVVKIEPAEDDTNMEQDPND